MLFEFSVLLRCPITIEMHEAALKIAEKARLQHL